MAVDRIDVWPSRSATYLEAEALFEGVNGNRVPEAVRSDRRRKTGACGVALEEALDLEHAEAVLVVGLATGEEELSLVRSTTKVTAEDRHQVAGQGIFLRVSAFRSPGS